MSRTGKRYRHHAEALQTPAAQPVDLVARARELLHTNTPYAIALAAEAREIVGTSGDRSLLAEIYRILGVGHAVSGAYSEAMTFFQTGFQLQKDLGNYHGAVIMLTNTGNVYNFLGDYSSALSYYTRSRDLCEQHAIEQHLPALYLNMGYSYRNLQNYEAAMESLTTGFSVASRLDKKQVMAHILHNLGNIYCARSDYPAALHAFGNSLALNTELNYHHGIAAVLIDMGALHVQTGNYAQALRHLKKSLDICERVGDRRGAALALNNIGDIYARSGRYNSALQYFSAGLRIKEELSNKTDIAGTVLNIGKTYGSLGDTRTALSYCRRCIRLAEDIGDSHMLADALCVAAEQYSRIAKHHRAQTYLRRALLLFTSLGHTEGCVRAQLALGLLHAATDDTDKALRLLTQALRTAGTIENPHLLMRMHEALAQVYKQAGNAGEALRHYECFHSLERTLFAEENERHRQRLLVTFDMERERKNRQLAEKEAGILRLENSRLEQEMAFRAKELLTTAMYLTQKNTSLKKLRHTLRALPDKPASELRLIIRELLHDIDTAVNAEHSWAHFEQQFRQVHQEYIEQIAARFPDITPTELKVCALIKLNLSTKEIAAILNTEAKSIEKYRQRIRKKLGLSQSDNLASFLHSLH